MGHHGARRTILVTGAAGPAGRALGVQLGRRTESVRAVGVDLVPTPVPGMDEVHAAPPARSAEYEARTVALLRSLEPSLVIPTVSDELPRMAVLARAAGLGYRVVISAPGPTAVADDKLLTMWALDHAGVTVPRHAPADELGTAADALRWAGGPVVLKPRVSRGGRGVHVVTDPADAAWQHADASWIVQELAPGDEYSPQVYRSPATGTCDVVVLRKTALEHGIVGNAADVERLPAGAAADVEELAVRTVEVLGLVGPVDMDVRRLADGTPVVLEVNARFGALSASAPELLDAVLESWPR